MWHSTGIDSLLELASSGLGGTAGTLTLSASMHVWCRLVVLDFNANIGNVLVQVKGKLRV